MSAVMTKQPTVSFSMIRRRLQRRRKTLIFSLIGLLVVLFFANLIIGQTWYSIADVWAVLLGRSVPDADYAVGELRLPRATLAILTGLCFGMAGAAFQTMLRNPLASPDIVGISSGASAAAVFAIVMLHVNSTAVSMLAVLIGLLVALVIYLLAYKRGVNGARLILVGIGVAAIMQSITEFLLSRAGQWDLQEAMRWLTGSLNGVTWPKALPVLGAILVFAPILLGQSRNLSLNQLGDDTAQALGVRVNRMRLLVVISAVALIAFATSATGPIAFVAFLAGPIVARLLQANTNLLIPAALVGACLVLVSDLIGHNFLMLRYPVGVVTGILGAPYLIYLVIRANKGPTGM